MIFAGFWFGIVPQTFSPLSPLSLNNRDQWFVDLKLAVLRRDPKLCQSILKPPYVNAIPVADSSTENGCGWANSFRFSEISDAKINVLPITCEMTAALSLWARYELQPAAIAILGYPSQKSITWGLTAAATSMARTGAVNTPRRMRLISRASRSRTAARYPCCIIGKVDGPKRSFCASTTRSLPLFPGHAWTRIQRGSRRPLSL